MLAALEAARRTTPMVLPVRLNEFENFRGVEHYDAHRRGREPSAALELIDATAGHLRQKMWLPTHWEQRQAYTSRATYTTESAVGFLYSHSPQPAPQSLSA